MRRFIAALLGALLFASPAVAQYISQSGALTPGHTLSVVTSGVVQDAGTSANPNLNAVAVYGSGGCPISLTSTTVPGVPTGQYVQSCLSATNSGVTLSVIPAGGLATVPFTIDINGTSYAIGGTNWLSGIFDSQFCSTQGSVLFRAASDWKCLLPGTSGQVLTSGGGGADVSWTAAAGTGTVTSIATGLGLTGGTITTTGTIATNGVLADLAGIVQAQGDVYYYNGTHLVALTAGTSGQVLETLGASFNPQWANATQLLNLGTGVETALAVNVGTAGAFVVNGGALGTPSSGVVTNLTGTASININGTVGATTPAAGNFTTLGASGNVQFNGLGTGVVANALCQDSSGNVISSGAGVDCYATGTSITKESIAGFLPTAISGTSTTAAVTISAGQAADSTSATYISASGSTSWAVSNGNAINGYAGGTTLPNSSTINFFMCSGGSGTGSYASTSLAPTCPAGYATYQRRIFSLVTSSTGALLPGNATEVSGGALEFDLSTVVVDVNAATIGSTGSLERMTVPLGFSVEWFGRVGAGGSGIVANVLSPLEPANGPSGANSTPGADLFNGSGGTSGATFRVLTNASAQIELISASNQSMSAFTRGWTDFRRN